MVLEHIFPVFALLLLGIVCKKTGLTDEAFLQAADRLIYYLFFPVLLFWKIGSAPQSLAAQSLNFYLAAVCAVLLVYVLSILCILFLKVPAFQAGAFSQSSYRFNTYVGMALINSIMGEAGIAKFGILIGAVIPIINILAVSTLIWFSKGGGSLSARLRICVRTILKNPLILGCAAGMIYARWINTFPAFIENTLSLATSATLPLALISVGAGLTFATMKRYARLSSVAAVLKLLVLPATGYILMRKFGVGAEDMALGMLFFALPTSTAVYVLSSQLESDTAYASSAIALSTLLSFFSLTAVVWLFHA